LYPTERPRERPVALDLEHRPCRGEAHTIAERSDFVLHQIGAEVEEQKQRAQQEEHDDEDCRHEADEDVRQDQLAAHAPQQTASREKNQLDQEVDGAGGDRHAGDRIDDGHERRHAAAAEPHGEHQQLDGNADNDGASGQRAQQ